jgi:hypothetical protein
MPPASLIALAGVLPALLCCQTATAADWGEDLLIFRGATEVVYTAWIDIPLWPGRGCSGGAGRLFPTHS